MGTYLNPGNSGFSDICSGRYVDKTGLISVLNGTISTPEKLTCISRPRRFGKSYAAQMLCAYYGKGCDSRPLFDRLSIASDPSYEKHLNQYNVIFFDIAAVKPSCDGFKALIPFLRERMNAELLEAAPSLRISDDLPTTLLNAVEALGVKFVMIIDEWDAPIRECPQAATAYLELLRQLFKNATITARLFAAVYMTGILPIKKMKGQSAISDFEEYTMLDPGPFEEYVGFTTKEVEEICAEYKADLSEMKHWYDGYQMSETGSVYNPNSVVKAARRKRFDTYWSQSSAADNLMDFIRWDVAGLRQAVIELMGGVEIEIDTAGYDNDLTYTTRDAALTMFVHLGYLSYSRERKTVRIPNEEIRLEFARTLKQSANAETMKRVKLPTGIQDFEKLRQEGFVYVDKTRHVFALSQSQTPYFLSRPRRFGKSLLLSTFLAYWEGKKELFEGLEIEGLENSKEHPWESYPVFYFDFNRKNYNRETALEEILDDHLKSWERRYGADSPDTPLEERFQHLLVRAFEQTKKRCVVLVDEYDKPLLDIMENSASVEHNKAVFKGFFSTLKSHDRYLQFVLITGVTKFNKISIFSDINQLEDISFVDDYADICGITWDELCTVFQPEISAMASAKHFSSDDCVEKLRERYDGYRFSARGHSVYNPYSLLLSLKQRKFGSYWFETGTPTFLVNRLKELSFDVRGFSKNAIETTEKALSDYRADNPDPVPLLYQSGYLSIKGCDEESDLYTLGFPNREVSEGFLESLLPAYVENCGPGSGKDILSLKRKAETGDLDGIRDTLTALFASIPYSAPSPGTPDLFEHYFQTVLHIVFTLLGKYMICELHTFRGRIDCILETRHYVYIFELKRDGTAEEALRQIEAAGYALPYSADGRQIFRIGVSFDSATRMPNDWKAVQDSR